MNSEAAISSITRGPRQSNIEILRIIAMFLVLVVHADFCALKGPTAAECHALPVASFTRIFFEAVAVLCVNTFVLISGWFTIKPTLKGFCNFIFQCAYFFIGIYVVMMLLGLAQPSLKGLKGIVEMNWFIKAYIGLYILAPVLNIFCEKASKTQFKAVVIGFFTFQTLYGCTASAKFFVNGYSTLSFIGLYLLAQYVRRYVTISSAMAATLLVGTILINAIGYFVMILMGEGEFQLYIFNYINPLVIIGALSALVLFANMTVKHNRFINWVAASSFAVFLVHFDPNIIPYYFDLIRGIYNDFSGIPCLLVIFGALIIIFAASILFDQPRRYLWSRIAKAFG